LKASPEGPGNQARRGSRVSSAEAQDQKRQVNAFFEKAARPAVSWPVTFIRTLILPEGRAHLPDEAAEPAGPTDQTGHQSIRGLRQHICGRRFGAERPAVSRRQRRLAKEPQQFPKRVSARNCKP